MDRHVKPQSGIPLENEGDYYLAASRNIMRIINIQTGVILFLTGAFCFFIITKENRDSYFAETIEGQKMRMQGLRFPNLGKMALADWVSQAVTQVMNFGFNDINERFARSQRNFTAAGWENFSKAMLKSELLKNMMKSQQIISSALLSPPELTREGLIKGVYTWHYSMPVLITFRAGGVVRTEKKTVEVTVEKIDTRISPNGVGIGTWAIY